MTGDALAEMEHKHVSDTICGINGRQIGEVQGGRKGGMGVYVEDLWGMGEAWGISITSMSD